MGIENRDWYREFKIDLAELPLTEEEKKKLQEQGSQSNTRGNKATKKWLSAKCENSHAPKQERCKMCGRIFSNKKVLLIHHKLEHENK